MPRISTWTRRLPVGFLLLAQATFAASGTVPQPADLGPELDVWRARHGASWRMKVDDETGRLEMLYGGRAEPSFVPHADAEFAVLARAAIAETSPLHGIEVETLELERVQFLPLGLIGSTDKMTVRFRQGRGAIPVEGGAMNALFDMHGRLLSIQSRGIPRLSALDATPTLAAVLAERVALEAFAHAERLQGVVTDEPRLVFVRAPSSRVPGSTTGVAPSAGKLAWRVSVRWDAPDVEPIGWACFVDAHDGAWLGHERTVHEFDVSGNVRSLVTPGIAPDEAGNAATIAPMRYMRITSSAGNATSDANGDFNIVGASAPLAVTVTYQGTFNDVQNSAGAPYSLTQTLSSSSGNVITLNPTAQGLVTAQANAFHHINLERDWLRSINPTDDHADFVHLAHANLAQTCNAYYDGGSTNYFQAGGGCVNTAYATVVEHENGHWLNDRYNTGNGNDGMGEGNADVWAMYSLDTPLVGQDFCGVGCNIRTGLNTRPFCGDTNPGCYGEVHADGEVWMGAAWKVHDRLTQALGNVQGDLVAGSLFLGWMNAYNQTQIRSIIETQWLTLDDNDGDLNNGSPHYASIDAGFRAQSFPGVDLHPLTVSSATVVHNSPNVLGPYAVDITLLEHVAGANITGVTLFWRVNGGTYSSRPMLPQSASSYASNIPIVPAPSQVDYYIVATDDHATTLYWPSTAPAVASGFLVGSEVLLSTETFEGGAPGWTHGSYGDTSNSADDWQLGTPAGKSGSSAQGPVFLSWSDPHGAFSGLNAFANDLGNGTNGNYSVNVHEWLRSPVMSFAGQYGVHLNFRRWLSVQANVYDQARIRVNGNVVWTNPADAPILESGWTQQDVDISDWADNNSSVQVEWELKTNGSCQLGGWNIDDVEFLALGPAASGCPISSGTTGYGPGKMNSTGGTAALGFVGSPSFSANDLQLLIYGAVPNQLSVVYSSSTPGYSSYLGGTLLLGTPLTREIGWQLTSFGDSNAFIPVTPALVGTTRFYQAFFRDPSSPDGSGYGVSRALRVDFCP